MREAAIDSRRALPRDRRGGGRKRRYVTACLAPIGRLVAAHPFRTVVATIFGLMLAGIVLNAVLLQRGRHPAPLFGSASRARQAHVPTASVPLPLRRPVERPSAEPLTIGQIAGSDDAAGSSRPAGTSPAHKEDGIAQLLRGGGRTQPDPANAKTSAVNVLAAQRALQKLGYDVKPDGHMGAATRQALDKFEHDRHLSAQGELSSKVLRELADAAGLPRE